MKVYPPNIPCRFTATSPFRHSVMIPLRIRHGMKKLLAHSDSEGPRHTAYMCHDMDHYLSMALANGDMNIGYFPLIIRAYDRPRYPAPDEIGCVRLELLGIRLMFEKMNTFSHPYARDAGFILQRLAIGNMNISGWMVSINGDRAYLGRPPQNPYRCFNPEIFDADDRMAARFILSRISRVGRPRLSHFER